MVEFPRRHADDPPADMGREALAHHKWRLPLEASDLASGDVPVTREEFRLVEVSDTEEVRLPPALQLLDDLLNAVADGIRRPPVWMQEHDGIRLTLRCPKRHGAYVLARHTQSGRTCSSSAPTSMPAIFFKLASWLPVMKWVVMPFSSGASRVNQSRCLAHPRA